MLIVNGYLSRMGTHNLIPHIRWKMPQQKHIKDQIFYASGKRVACIRVTTQMIRITAQHDSSATRLFLEGKLSGPCVDELDKCWREMLVDRSVLLVDLTNVSFVDEHGKELLARMHNKGIKLFSTSLMTKCLIDEIENTPATLVTKYRHVTSCRHLICSYQFKLLTKQWQDYCCYSELV